jgi:hypothetical protein
MDKTDVTNNFTATLNKITIVKNGVEFTVLPWKYPGYPPMESLIFTEDINSSNIGGTLFIKDIYSWSELLNLHSFEKLKIEFIERYPSEEKPLKITQLEFNIFSVSQAINRPIQLIVEDLQKYTLLKIEFETNDILTSQTYGTFFTPENDFVGYIATDDTTEVKGLVNEIFKKLDIENYEIEPTFNGIWLKSNEISYPWGKNKGQISIYSLMQYICNFAISRQNTNAVNYFFWRDKEGYKFKSVERLLSEQAETEYEKLSFTDSDNIPNKIKNISIMKETNVLQLKNSNTLQAYYDRITPNYDEFYLDFVDTALSYTTEVVDFDYNRDHSLWKKIESYKIIPDAEFTSSLLPNNIPIQSVKIDDSIYGYHSDGKLNTPYHQEWDHIGKTLDSRWNDVTFIPQYDITDLDITTFHTIHKKIREPLRAKRKLYSRLKNLKRKWEVYRCSVCCLSDRLGGVQDEIDIKQLQGLDNPNENPDFLALFGPTGIFSDSKSEYKVVAAGSFSDVYNYDSNVAENRGLTLSYDFTQAPFNESIKDFYYFKDEFQNYEKYILDGGIKTYDLHLGKNNQILAMIDDFLNDVDFYISQANQFYNSYLTTENCSTTCRNYLVSNLPQTYDVNPAVLGACFNFPPNYFIPLEFIEETSSYKFITELSPWLFECSMKKYIPQYIQTYNLNDQCFPTKNFNRLPITNYHYNTVFTRGQEFESIENNQYKELYEKQLQDILDKKAYCPLCLNPISLEVLKRFAKNQKILLEQENILLIHLRDALKNEFIEKWKLAKQNYFNRKAFFVSKLEEKIKNNDEFVKNTNLSLMNIKSITRKSIRGSRYEILARNKGITGASVGQYLYNIFFDGLSSDIGLSGNHPYYDQTYTTQTENSFLSLPKPKKIKKIEDVISINDPDASSGWLYGPKNVFNDSKVPGYVQLNDEDHINFLEDLGYANTILANLENDGGVEEYEERYNLYNVDSNKKPPNIKREEISSYVRVEFNTPIGLESISDFPDGFIRNAGYEYFLPYIVSLTSGPNGRQTIKQNVVIIGMDPYGFDVAMKRIADDSENGKFYWWSNNLPVGQMDLWPEIAFETKYTYYTEHVPIERYFQNLSEIYSTSLSRYQPVGPARSVSSREGGAIDLSVTNYGVRGYAPQDSIKNNNSSDALAISNNAKYDSFLQETKNASSYLINSHKVMKVHRNWWAFHIPENLIIIPRFESILLDTTFASSDIAINYTDYTLLPNTDVKFSTYSKREYLSRLDEKEYNYLDVRQYSKALRLRNNSDVESLVQKFADNNISFFYEEYHNHPVISPYKNFEITNPGIKAYFDDITNYWMRGDHIMYMPNLITEDVWKYDLSGYSEYGINLPPVQNNHGDIFDHNFAAQFVVFGKSTDSVCSKNNLKCINPNGQVSSQGCPESDPYCNCPAQNRKPSEPEPSYLEIYKLEQELKECSLIEEHLGPEWLGCVWSNPNNTGSCNCPEIGDKFMDYMAYNRTYATFWSTPPKTPLLRNSQINLLFSQTVQVDIARNDNIKIGSIVLLEDFEAITGKKYKRFGGKWMVTQIVNIFYGNAAHMTLTLHRDSFNRDPNILSFEEGKVNSITEYAE